MMAVVTSSGFVDRVLRHCTIGSRVSETPNVRSFGHFMMIDGSFLYWMPRVCK